MESNQSGQSQQKGSNNKAGAIIASLIGIAVLVFVVNALMKNESGVTNENENVGMVNTNLPEVISSNVDTSDWKTYRNEELGIEFKYLANLKEYTSIRKGDEPNERGERGGRFIVALKDDETDPSQSIYLTGIGGDYSAPRGGYFGDSRGYSVDENGNYYYVSSLGSKDLIEPVGFIQAPIGKTILVDTSSFVEYRGLPSGPNPLPESLSALVNLPNNDQFDGFAVSSVGLDEKLFYGVLNSLQLIVK